ncbi:hypothetical protein OS493_001347 [Desmophyllum pertusum]|uniref:Uncharacterized protein n=1 Tax=Desmophyllum pertusum TaxID=174260 RepID=A0A9W9ZGQ7_9CNID|nr:hypothetical protein OS493_001347 [Desmophyllum pertusum]
MGGGDGRGWTRPKSPPGPPEPSKPIKPLPTPAALARSPTASAQAAASKSPPGPPGPSNPIKPLQPPAALARSPAASAQAAASKSPPAPEKRFHHKKNKCPVPDCSFNGNDLRRHLKVHVEKRDISEDAVEKLVTVVRAGQVQRGKTQARKGKARLKGKLKKWCPVDGCDQIVLDVGRHLRNKNVHALAKDSRKYQRLVRMARRYKGMDELEDSVIPPPPAIVEEVPRRDSDGDSESASDGHRDDGPISHPKKKIKLAPEPNPTPSDAANPSSDAANPAVEAEDPASDDASLPSCEESDEDNDYSSAQPKWINYFTATKPKNNRHQWLVMFFDFLTRPSAGDKKETIRLQHANQMRALLESVEPGGDDILCLLGHQGDAVWKLWVKPNLDAKTKKPGTIISYLTSYEKFLSFVTHSRFNRAGPPIHANFIKELETVKNDLKGWRSTVDSQSYAVKNQRFVDESEGLLTLDEVKQIRSSKSHGEAERIIIQAGKGAVTTLKEFLLVRDFLLTRFSLDTGTRPGPLNNATVTEYSAGKVKDSCKVMLVVRHKRAKIGPAICPMLPELHKFMQIYVTKIRPLFARPDVDSLFVTNEGISFKEGTIGRRLSAFVKKCGVRLGSRMAFVDMRKVITTEMLKRASPEERDILRRVLAHSEKTSRDWYTRPDLTLTLTHKEWTYMDR